MTWKLKDGVKWSDGTPVTSDDVKATWQYVMEPENGATYDGAVRRVSPASTRRTRRRSQDHLQGSDRALVHAIHELNGAVLQKAQIDTCADPKTCDLTEPRRHGAVQGEVVHARRQRAVCHQRQLPRGERPLLRRDRLKGGGDAGTAAKAVQTGQSGLRVEPAGDAGHPQAGDGRAARRSMSPGFGVEQISVNFTDPNKDVNGEKSSLKAPHPFLTDPKVREAISWLVDRDSIAKNLYGAAGKPTCNILPSVPPQTKSKNTTCGFDVAKANQILDDAGWKKGADGIRAKNGVRMQIVLRHRQPVREKEEQVIKAPSSRPGSAWTSRMSDAGVFFGQPDNPDAVARFERDWTLMSSGPHLHPDAQDFFSRLHDRGASPRRRTAGRRTTSAASATRSTTASSTN